MVHSNTGSVRVTTSRELNALADELTPPTEFRHFPRVSGSVNAELPMMPPKSCGSRL